MSYVLITEIKSIARRTKSAKVREFCETAKIAISMGNFEIADKMMQGALVSVRFGIKIEDRIIRVINTISKLI